MHDSQLSSRQIYLNHYTAYTANNVETGTGKLIAQVTELLTQKLPIVNLKIYIKT